MPHYFLSLSKASFSLNSPVTESLPVRVKHKKRNLKTTKEGLQTQTRNLKLTKPLCCHGFSLSSAGPSHHPKEPMISSPTSHRTICTPGRACSEIPRSCPFPFSSTIKHHFERAMGCVISVSPSTPPAAIPRCLSAIRHIAIIPAAPSRQAPHPSCSALTYGCATGSENSQKAHPKWDLYSGNAVVLPSEAPSVGQAFLLRCCVFEARLLPWFCIHLDAKGRAFH